MSTGHLSIQLAAPGWGTGADTLAVAEVTAAPRSGGTRGPGIKVALGVNDAPHALALDAGPYLVRLYLPSGDVQAERVEVPGGGQAQLTFDLDRSPHEWLGQATSMGVVQTLPRASEARALQETLSRVAAPSGLTLHTHAQARPQASVKASVKGKSKARGADPGLAQVALDAGHWRELVEQAVRALQRTTSEIERISGEQRVAQAEGWRWHSRVDPNRPFPQGRLSTHELVQWWTGPPVAAPQRMRPVQFDERNVRLGVPAAAAGMSGMGRLRGDGVRAYAAVRDPAGGGHYAVLPEGWRSTSRQRIGQRVEASVLLTVNVDTAMTAEDSAGPARWRCAPEVDDVEAMSLLGFLHTGQVSAGQMMLEQAHSWLLEKVVNPVAAAAGAYMLLSHAEQANASLSPAWRDWVGNLFRWFPALPDGAIAMAQMSMSFGETRRDEPVNVERLRGHALEAVRRGLPYLGTGVRRLTDVLVALEGDDRAEGRTGPLVERTREALSVVRQLGRIAVPGEFFTVLRLDEGRR